MKFAYKLLVSIFALYDSAKNKYQQVLEIYPEEVHARLMLARIDLNFFKPVTICSKA